MRKIIFSTSVLLLAFMFSACDQFDDVSLDDSMDVNVEGYVYDGITEEPIKGAVISGSFGTKKTNSDGYYSIKGLDMGQYRIEIEVEGYMTMVLTPTFQEKEEDFKGSDFNELLTTYMYMADQPVSTQLVKVVGPTVQALPDLPYTIELLGAYKDRFIYGKTDANGMLMDTIPDDAFSIEVDTVIDDMEYSFYNTFGSPSSLSQAYAVNITDLSITSIYLESANIIDADGLGVQDFDPTSDIVLTFNQALDIEKSEIVVRKQGVYDVKVDIEFSEGNKKVVISAFDGDFEKSESYSLSLDVVAASNEKSLMSDVLQFTTSGDIISSLSKPSVFKLETTITDFTNNIDFELTVDVESDYIEVYGRYNNDEDFVYFHNESITWEKELNGIIQVNNLWLTNLPNIDVPVTGLFSANNDYEIIIRSKVYSNGQWVYSEFSDIKLLQEGDLAQ